MKKLEENQQVTQLTLELTTLDQTFRDPKFKGLIDQGYRIAQMVLCPVIKAKFEEVDNLDETERGKGGFGSTGTK